MPDIPLEATYRLGALIILAVLVWAILRVSGRNRANDTVTEAATRAELDQPDTYDQRQFQDQIQK